MTTFRKDWLLVITATGPALLSAYFSWHLVDGGGWFQRSGSLMVLFAAWLDFRQARLLAEASPEQRVELSLLMGLSRAQDDPRRVWFQRLAIWLLITGTVIWGYGDLPFR
ncbi:hypothetical protein CVH10_01500 [Halomonas sp. ND22Bw]|uniref:hypothetical protein n=1 Tax=Halomonas sp. ND22Bw TaxID=2054178 RepID=UPI000D0B208B|nr:hypothetical protein CVH10_01500 [Halomonas sp. ND22Bw]